MVQKQSPMVAYVASLPVAVLPQSYQRLAMQASTARKFCCQTSIFKHENDRSHAALKRMIAEIYDNYMSDTVTLSPLEAEPLASFQAGSSLPTVINTAIVQPEDTLDDTEPQETDSGVDYHQIYPEVGQQMHDIMHDRFGDDKRTPIDAQTTGSSAPIPDHRLPNPGTSPSLDFDSDLSGTKPELMFYHSSIGQKTVEAESFFATIARHQVSRARDLSPVSLSLSSDVSTMETEFATDDKQDDTGEPTRRFHVGVVAMHGKDYIEKTYVDRPSEGRFSDSTIDPLCIGTDAAHEHDPIEETHLEDEKSKRLPNENRLAIRTRLRGQYSEPCHSAEDLAASQAVASGTDRMKDMTTCYDAQISLLDFAPEILLNTLSCLGLSDILRARIFSSYFKQTIDNASNFPLLVPQARFKSMKKLDKLASIDDCNVHTFDYLQILAELVARRGLWTTKDPYILTIHIMMDLFMRRGPGNGVARAVTWNSFWRLGYNAWQVHIQHHLPRHGLRCINWVPCVDVFDFVRRIRTPALEVFGITENRMAVWYNLLTETPGGYFQSLSGPRLAGEAARMGGPVIPQFCLTGLYAFDSEISMRPLCPELKNHYRAPVVPDASRRLAAMLKIPELPTQFEAYGRMYENGYAFAWCVHSESVFKKVQDALTRVDGKELKPLEEAIIMEDLFLF